MTYSPKLRYAFCIMRRRSLWSQLSLIKYLNRIGIEPVVYLGRDVLLEDLKGAKFQRSGSYDVMFSESAGFDDFERRLLKKGKKNGKINVKLQNAMSLYRNIVNTNYSPDKTKDTLHGMCMKNQRTIEHYKTFTKNLFYLNVGDPDWDWFYTTDFKSRVSNVKKRYGSRILLLGTNWCLSDNQLPYYKRIIEQAEREDYKVIIRVHVELYNKRRDELNRYIDNTTDRFVLFAAASHVIENLSSTMLSECLYLRKIVGCTPAIFHSKKYGGPHIWVDNYSRWLSILEPKVGSEIINLIPRIMTKKETSKFLATKSISNESVDRIFGWPRVSCYCEYLFKVLESKIG